MSDSSELIEQIDRAILGLNPLTGFCEDNVWRPADRARFALIAAREKIEELTTPSPEDASPGVGGREAIARIIERGAWEVLDLHGPEHAKTIRVSRPSASAAYRIEGSLAKADAILALSTGEGKEDLASCTVSAARKSAAPEAGSSLEWRDIEGTPAPRDGKPFEVWGRHFKWPEAAKWQEYDADDAEEAGEPGYWAYAEEVLADAMGECDHEMWTHWRPIAAPSSEAPTISRAEGAAGSSGLDEPSISTRLAQVAEALARIDRAWSVVATQPEAKMMLFDVQQALANVRATQAQGETAETTGFIEPVDAPRPAKATGHWSDVWDRHGGQAQGETP